MALLVLAVIGVVKMMMKEAKGKPTIFILRTLLKVWGLLGVKFTGRRVLKSLTLPERV